jgi:hypothetical protein
MVAAAGGGARCQGNCATALSLARAGRPLTMTSVFVGYVLRSLRASPIEGTQVATTTPKWANPETPACKPSAVTDRGQNAGERLNSGDGATAFAAAGGDFHTGVGLFNGTARVPQFAPCLQQCAAGRVRYSTDARRRVPAGLRRV